MKITFLGTSHGAPCAERYCSSTMIEINGALYFIDAGAPLTDAVLRQGKHPNDIRAIFTTHAHGDHVYGIIPFADMLCWWYKKANVEIYLTEQTMIDAMTGVIEAGLGHMSRERVRFHLMEEDFIYEDENIRLWLIPNCHLKNRSDTHDRPSYSIVLESEGKRLIFTGDMSMGLRQDDFPRIAIEEPSDFILCEMAHFGAEPVEEYIKQCKTKQVWFNHVSFKQELFDAIEEMDKKYPFTVKAANDGDTVIL